MDKTTLNSMFGLMESKKISSFYKNIKNIYFKNNFVIEYRRCTCMSNYVIMRVAFLHILASLFEVP